MDCKEKICLTVGNAGVIAWKFNSHAIGALGKTGTAKTILFTPEKMQTVIKKEQPTPIPPSGEENNQDKEKAVVRNPGTVSSQEQASREENTTQTTKEKAKEAGTVSKPVPIKKNEGNNLGNISKQSISVDKIQKGTQSVKM